MASKSKPTPTETDEDLAARRLEASHRVNVSIAGLADAVAAVSDPENPERMRERAAAALQSFVVVLLGDRLKLGTPAT